MEQRMLDEIAVMMKRMEEMLAEIYNGSCPGEDEYDKGLNREGAKSAKKANRKLILI